MIRERLDKALVNLEWEEAYPCTQVQNFPTVGFDHSPIMVNFDFHDKRALRRFKFEIIWVEMEECVELIRKGWECKGQGSQIYKLVQKLKGCRTMLTKWSKEAVRNNKKVIEELNKKVAEIQGGMDMEVRFNELREVMQKLKET